MQHISIDQIGSKIDEHCHSLANGPSDYLTYAEAIFVANKYYRSHGRNINQDVSKYIKRASEQSADQRVSKVELRNIINNLQHTYGNQDTPANTHSGQNSQTHHTIQTSQIVGGSTLYKSELHNGGSVTRLSHTQRRPSYTSRQPVETVTYVSNTHRAPSYTSRPVETVTTHHTTDNGFVGSRRSIRFESNMTSNNGTLAHIGETRTYGEHGEVVRVSHANNYTKSYIDGGRIGSQTHLGSHYGGTSYITHAPVTTTYTTGGERHVEYSNRGSNTRVIRERSLSNQRTHGISNYHSITGGDYQAPRPIQTYHDHRRQGDDRNEPTYVHAQGHIAQHETQQQLINGRQHLDGQQHHSSLQQIGEHRQQNGVYQQGQHQQDYQQLNGSQTQHQGQQQVYQQGHQQLNGEQSQHQYGGHSQHQEIHGQGLGQSQDGQGPRLGVVNTTNFSQGYHPSNYNNVEGYTSELKNVNLKYSGFNQVGSQQESQVQHQQNYNNANGQNYNRA